MENLTTETFKEKVFDYIQNEEWSFKGTKPAIIDFYADWCEPCKTIAPIFEQLDAEYEGVDFYKVNTEKQQELAATFGIRSIPSILFVPVEGQPQMAVGALPKEIFKKAIGEVLFGEKREDEVEIVEDTKEDDTIEIIGDDLIVTVPVEDSDETETKKVPLKEE